MPVSMTGFGRSECAKNQWSVKLEMKSVNHRYLDVVIRLPKSYHCLEEPMRNRIQEKITRGRVEIFATIEELGERDRMVKIDRGLLRGFLAEWEHLQDDLPLPDPTLEHLLLLPDMVSVLDPDIDWEELTELIMKTLDHGIAELVQMRNEEGLRLTSDILQKLTNIEQQVTYIENEAPKVVLHYSTRLKERLQELLEGTTLTEERFNTEVAIFADRCSIDEEIVRLRCHTQQFHQSLAQNVPIGRKLDFLIQEMNREVNTIGSKANNSVIAAHAVELKSELERLREQIQNLE